jgi:hypothetical protein
MVSPFLSLLADFDESLLLLQNTYIKRQISEKMLVFLVMLYFGGFFL